MRVFPCLGLAAVIALSGTGAAGVGAQSATQQPAFVPGELIVKYRADAVPTARGRARAGAAVAAIGELARGAASRGQGRIELVRTARGMTLQAARLQLLRDPAVEYAEPNWIYRHQQTTPTDPLFAQQWALENTGQAVSGIRGTADADIDALQGWSPVAGAGVPAYVAVIDEGIDVSHPDLGVQPGGAIWTNPFDPIDGLDNDGNGYVDDLHGWDFWDQTNTVYDGTPAESHIDSHGTHVAGTIAARHNGIGIAGVSRDVVIIPAKFMGVNGGTTAGAIQALDYLTDLKVRHGLNIIATNNSWGGGGFSQALLDAITRAANAQILFIVAAGNGGPDEIGDDSDWIPSYPGNYDTTATAGYNAVISVAATDPFDALTGFSNYGLTTVHLAAPGAVVISTTPQNTYGFSSGTSMAAPHVTGAAALAHAISGKTGAELRDAILAAVDPVPALAGRTMTGGRLNLGRLVASGGPSSNAGEIVLYPAGATAVFGNWTVQADPTAAGGARLQSTNLGIVKVAPALAAPGNYVEMTFTAEAGRAYHLWMRARAESNNWANDSVHVQFDHTVTAAGAAVYRIGTTGSTEVNLEDCSGCGLSGWGWQDNGYGSGVQGAALFFATTGPQRIRIQTREDGVGIDQIVLSSTRFVSAAPGSLKNDGTILGASTPAGNEADGHAEVVLYAADPSAVTGAWVRTPDPTAAGGARLQNLNLGAAKLTGALLNPAAYFDMTFQADAGRPYRLWIRAKAASNNWANDSVHVQFSDTVTATGAAQFRIGSASSTEVNLEDCTSCGVAGWGWQDNGYGAAVLGPELRFAAAGTHTIRVQVREDGIGIDQIVLSSARFLTTSPGSLKNDSTILARTGQ